jgi:hypothetical protein
LDIFLGDAERLQLWENDGHGTYREVARFAGSLNYKAAPGATACLATDLNHDGWTDLALFYEVDGLVYHFNRGFRCLGEEGGLKLSDLDEPPAVPSLGVQDCAAADFNGDGSVDLAVVFGDGSVYVFYNSLMDLPSARLRLAQGQAGPVTFSVWRGESAGDCRGVWCVGDGHAQLSHLGFTKAGRCILKWALPGQPNLNRILTPQRQIVDVNLTPSP